MPAFWGGLISGGASLLGGILGGNAQSSAAAQEQAALQKALQFQEGVYGTAQTNLNPFIKTGDNEVYSLASLFGLPGAPGTPNGGNGAAQAFQNYTQTPGYQFGLQQGMGAQQASAAANGSLLTGGTQNALDQYAQNYADTNYNNVYNQALQTYGTNYNVWANQQASEYNKLASMAGAGQTTAQTLNTEGLQSTGQIANTLNSTGQQIGQQNTNAAAATASGYVGSANALGGALTGATGNLSQLAMLYSLMNGGQYGQSSTPNGPGSMSWELQPGTAG